MPLPCLASNHDHKFQQNQEIAWEMWFNVDSSRIIIIAPDKKTAAIHQNKDEVDRVLIKPFSLEELTGIVLPYRNPAY